MSRSVSFVKRAAALACAVTGLALFCGSTATAATQVEYRVCVDSGNDVTAAIVFPRGNGLYDIGAMARPGSCGSAQRGPVQFEIWAYNSHNRFQKIASYASGGSQPCVKVWSRDGGRLFVYSLQWWPTKPVGCNAK